MIVCYLTNGLHSFTSTSLIVATLRRSIHCKYSLRGKGSVVAAAKLPDVISCRRCCGSSATKKPVFHVSGEKINILYKPKEFYEVLTRKTRNAKRRIIVSSLYIGTGPLEQSLVQAWLAAGNLNPRLIIRVLLDHSRASRGRDSNSRTMLLPLMSKLGCDRVRVSLYHSPYLRGVVQAVLPSRWNELVGLNHMKIYVADDDLILSGANLSDQYFVDRQDRYVVFENCRRLADFFHDLVDVVASFSFRLTDSDDVRFSTERQIYHPYEGVLASFVDDARRRVENLIDGSSSENEDSKCDTRVRPQIQMGQLGIDHDLILTTELIRRLPHRSSVKLATGYFNLVDEYVDAILDESRARYDILMASPQANGFYGAGGVSGSIPSAYTRIASKIHRRIHRRPLLRNRIRFHEYYRRMWTFHAKGLWVYEDSETKTLPHLTIIGSPNFGYRSVHRDLECQVCIETNNVGLKNQLHAEQKNLFRYSEEVTSETYESKDRRVALWVKIVTRLFPSLF